MPKSDPISSVPFPSVVPVQAATLPRSHVGSRRRRLWELAERAHCPVIGTCLPVPTLRRFAAKLLGRPVEATDYALHATVVADCAQRTPMAELVQRELDRRYDALLRSSASCRDSTELGAWWSAACSRGDVAGALWAVLTHARCDFDLEERVVQDLHMLQHQAGSAARADLRRLAQLEQRNAGLEAELADLRRRVAEQSAEQADRLAKLQASEMQLRAALLAKVTALAEANARLQGLQVQLPDLADRQRLLRDNARQADRVEKLQQALQRARQEIARLRQAAPSGLASAAGEGGEAGCDPGAPAASHPLPPVLPRLEDRAVLCVGGRRASVPIYRALIERTGGRFLHHDGDEGVATLDATLAAADLVICQTGCLSHDAYWRVKSHCKRAGKPCVFVDKPSASSLRRALCVQAADDAAAMRE